MPQELSRTRSQSFRKNIPWWGWAFIVLVRLWTVVMTVFTLAVAVVGILLLVWMGKHPGRTDLTPFFTSLASHVGFARDSLRSGKP